jgi:hypothetical protein
MCLTLVHIGAGSIPGTELESFHAEQNCIFIKAGQLSLRCPARFKSLGK